MPSTSPHMVENDDNPSITVSFTYYTDATRRNSRLHACISGCATRGLSPAPVGTRAARDALLGSLHRRRHRGARFGRAPSQRAPRTRHGALRSRAGRVNREGSELSRRRRTRTLADSASRSGAAGIARPGIHPRGRSPRRCGASRIRTARCCAPGHSWCRASPAKFPNASSAAVTTACGVSTARLRPTRCSPGAPR